MSFARIRLLFGAHGVASGFLLPFPVLLLSGRGVDAATIGLVLGAAAFVSMLAFPVWGLLADGPLGRERSVVLSGLIAALAGTCILLSGSNVTFMSAGIVVAWVGMAAWAPITDAMALAALGDRSGAYGRSSGHGHRWDGRWRRPWAASRTPSSAPSCCSSCISRVPWGWRSSPSGRVMSGWAAM